MNCGRNYNTVNIFNLCITSNKNKYKGQKCEQTYIELYNKHNLY